MKVAAVVSTKRGPGKTTVGVNPGAFCADAGLRTRRSRYPAVTVLVLYANA